jgi:transcription elongation GreA/GreB family factor
MRAGFLLRQTKTGFGTFTKVFATVIKSSLRDAIIRQLQMELARQAGAAHSARDEAISEESRAENKWDTHSQEAAYLAEGQAKLAADIRASIELYSTIPLPEFAGGATIALGAVVELAGADEHHTWYVLGPRAGGMELDVEGRHFLVLTPHSPLGRQLIGKRAGDTVQVAARGTPAVQRIVSVQ